MLMSPGTLVSRLQETKISLPIGAAVVLGAGYADLARGGTTISAFLLAIAYCVLIPLALWSHASGEGPVGGERPSYRAASVASVVVFGLYVATMAPSTEMW